MKQFAALPSNFHTFDLLSDLLLENGEGKPRLIDNLESLKEKGWLLYDKDEDAFKMHRVVQIVVEKMRHSFEDVEVLVRNVSRLAKYDQYKDNPVRKFKWIPFGEHLAELVWEKNHKDISFFLDYIANLYEQFGQYEDAVKLSERSLKIAKSIFEEGHEIIATQQSNLANIHTSLGKYDRARNLLSSALSSDLENFGEVTS